MPLAVDLLHPTPASEKRKHKLKRLVPHPNSYFMDVKCPGCYRITTVFSHAQRVVVCAGCSTILCQPTGGRARLTEGVYKLDCDCGLSYIGQTKRSIGVRVKEHISDIKNGHVSKSAVCEHTVDKPSHYIRFDKPLILAKENRYIPRMIREAIEIQKYPNFNREDGWKLSNTWDPPGCSFRRKQH